MGPGGYVVFVVFMLLIFPGIPGALFWNRAQKLKARNVSAAEALRLAANGLFTTPPTFTASDRGIHIVGEVRGAPVTIDFAHAPASNWYLQTGGRGYMLTGYEGDIQARMSLAVAMDVARPPMTLRSTSKVARLEVEEPRAGDMQVSESDFAKIWHVTKGAIDLDEELRTALLKLQWKRSSQDLSISVENRALVVQWCDGIQSSEREVTLMHEWLMQVVDVALLLRARLSL